MLQDWFKLEEIYSTDTPQMNLIKLKTDIEFSKKLNLQYLDCVNKSNQNKIYW